MVFCLLLVLGFASINVNCQQPVTDVVEVEITLPFDCLHQDLVGTLTVERTFFNNHSQNRIYGTMTGQSDGLEYYVEMINNIAEKTNWEEWGQQAFPQTWPGNYHISRDGKLIGVMYFAYHYTYNANAVLSSLHGYVYEYSCVGEGKIK